MGRRFSESEGELLVLDTSVVINLNATGHAEQIFQALPHSVQIVDVVVAELEAGRAKGRTDIDRVTTLAKDGFVSVANLNNESARHFEDLVFGSGADTLDDGEAASIAHALTLDARAIIDERKANRICSARFPQLRMGCTVDLLAHPSVQHSLGSSVLAEATYQALKIARMRVLPDQVEWVVRLIGADRAATCASLALVARRAA